jgi:hypothetical protein
MSFPADLPPSLRKIWSVQYAPRERIVLSRLKKDGKRKYLALPYTKKIQTIDLLEGYGEFKG